jgi:hypothetical protein
MWMIHPNQADSLQGLQGGNVEALAANDLGIGSGWQQSKQNWALSAVVGKWIRVVCSDLCLLEDNWCDTTRFFTQC